jgi:Metal binding domain of Ada
VRADGRIGEYGAGGPAAKREVLGHEGIDTGAMERLAGSGVRFTGSDTTGVYCYPSCRHARRISAPHVVRFRDAAEARAAGYRPCKVCRPLEGTPFAA